MRWSSVGKSMSSPHSATSRTQAGSTMIWGAEGTSIFNVVKRKSSLKMSQNKNRYLFFIGGLAVMWSCPFCIRFLCSLSAKLIIKGLLMDPAEFWRQVIFKAVEKRWHNGKHLLTVSPAIILQWKEIKLTWHMTKRLHLNFVVTQAQLCNRIDLISRDWIESKRSVFSFLL